MLSLLFPFARTSRKAAETQNVVIEEDQLMSGLAKLCTLPRLHFGQSSPQMSDETVQRVSSVLRVLDTKYDRRDWNRWADRPRTYIILWNVGGLQYMDEYVQRRCTDFGLPYDNRTLPGFIQDEKIRESFLLVQNCLLTSAKEIENLSDWGSPNKVLPHIHLDGSGDQHFRRISSLGQGGFGAVDEVWSNLSLTQYARKRVCRSKQTSETNRRAQEYLVQELTELKKLSHRHLVKVFGSYTDKEYIAFLMKPVAECNLRDFLCKPGGLTDRDRHDVRKFYGCLAGALHYLHKSNVRHRDLSSRNILIQKGEIFISDLGSAYKWIEGSSRGSITQDRDVPPSLEYMAPEVAKKVPRSSSSDMWSLGVVFLEMTTLLIGSSLEKLHAAIEQGTRDQNPDLQPYIWANPRIVNTWVTKLQQSNRGPQHDNEPLVWVRDLLNERPNDRPKAQMLMQDILESASFNIFCCIECQPEFRERRFQYGDMQLSRSEIFDDFTEVRNNIVNLLKDPEPNHSFVSKQSSSIENWLANSLHWEPPPIPGNFSSVYPDWDEKVNDEKPLGTIDTYDKENDNRTSVESALSSPLPLPPPPPPPISAFERTQDPNPLPFDEPIELLGDTCFHHQHEANASSVISVCSLRQPMDTGLGFLEYDSSSSSDDEDESMIFHELEDSSGSDSDSIATVVPSKYDHGKRDLVKDKAPKPISTLPKFTGEENAWIQTLDTLPEDQDQNPNLASSETLLLKSPATLNTTNPPEKTSYPMKQYEVESETIVDSDKIVLDETLSNALTLYPSGQPGMNELENVETEVQTSGTNTTDTIVKTKAEEPEESTLKDVLGLKKVSPIEISTAPIQQERKNSSIPRLMSFEAPPTVTQVSKDAEEKRVRSEACAPDEKAFRTVEANANILVLRDTPTDSVESPQDGSDNKHPHSPPVTTSAPTQRIPQVEYLSTDRFQLKKSPTGVKGETHTKLSRANVASLNDIPSRPSQVQRKKRDHIPGISASDYIENTWEEASTVATSVMSERTSKLLQGISLNKWLDKDHKLLETFCAKGKVEAVRVLLSNGCNPGKPEGPKQRRRIGPIMHAICGASERHNKCVRELIKYGVDVNTMHNKTGKTPLHMAIENEHFKGYENLIRDLIEAGADTNQPDFKDDRPIMKVFYGSDSGPLQEYRRRTLALLLRNAATEVNIILPGTLNTPLHLAVRRRDPYAVGMLLHKHADVNLKNASGATPLLLAANQFQSHLAKDHTILLKLLLETGHVAVDEKTGFNQQTALHNAVKSGASVAVELLITHGADPHCRDSQGNDACTIAIQNASSHLHDEHADIMIQLNDSMKKSWPLEDGSVCILEQACKDPNISLMQELLEAGLDPQCRKNKRPILHHAIGYGNQAVVKLLTEKGAFVDAKNENKVDAISYAINQDEESIAKYLVLEGRYQRKAATRMTLKRLEMMIARNKENSA